MPNTDSISVEDSY